MVGLKLPNNHTNVLAAAAIAHFNGGYFQQNVPPGWITVEADEQLKIERSQIELALGRPCPDELWQALAAQVAGTITLHSDEVLIIEKET